MKTRKANTSARIHPNINTISIFNLPVCRCSHAHQAHRPDISSQPGSTRDPPPKPEPSRPSPPWPQSNRVFGQHGLGQPSKTVHSPAPSSPIGLPINVSCVSSPSPLASTWGKFKKTIYTPRIFIYLCRPLRKKNLLRTRAQREAILLPDGIALGRFLSDARIERGIHLENGFSRHAGPFSTLDDDFCLGT